MGAVNVHVPLSVTKDSKRKTKYSVLILTGDVDVLARKARACAWTQLEGKKITDMVGEERMSLLRSDESLPGVLGNTEIIYALRLPGSIKASDRPGFMAMGTQQGFSEHHFRNVSPIVRDLQTARHLDRLPFIGSILFPISKTELPSWVPLEDEDQMEIVIHRDALGAQGLGVRAMLARARASGHTLDSSGIRHTWFTYAPLYTLFMSTRPEAIGKLQCKKLDASAPETNDEEDCAEDYISTGASSLHKPPSCQPETTYRVRRRR